jgi:hypothetical protein
MDPTGRAPVSVSFHDYTLIARQALESIYTYFDDQPEARRSTNRAFAKEKRPTGKTFERLALDPVLRRLAGDAAELAAMAQAMNARLEGDASDWLATKAQVWSRPPDGDHKRGFKRRLRQKFGDKEEPFYDFWVEVDVRNRAGDADVLCIPVNAKWSSGSRTGRPKRGAQRTAGGAALWWLLLDDIKPHEVKSTTSVDLLTAIGKEVVHLKSMAGRRCLHRRPRDYHLMVFQRSDDQDEFCGGSHHFSFLTVDPAAAFKRTLSAGFPHLQADFSSSRQNTSVASTDERILGFFDAFCEREIADLKAHPLLRALGLKIKLIKPGERYVKVPKGHSYGFARPGYSLVEVPDGYECQLVPCEPSAVS